MSAAPSEAGPSRTAVGAVLAGGDGQRIGGAKATVELAGFPLISYPLAAVRQAGLEPVVVAKPDSPLPELGCEVVREPDEPRHPLCGIVAALRHTGEGPLVAVACDMPLLSAELLAWLAATPESLVVPVVEEELQPFPGRYDPALLPDLEAALRERRAMRAAIDALGPRQVSEPELARFGDPRALCFNVNTPNDLSVAGRALAG